MNPSPCPQDSFKFLFSTFCYHSKEYPVKKRKGIEESPGSVFSYVLLLPPQPGQWTEGQPNVVVSLLPLTLWA